MEDYVQHIKSDYMRKLLQYDEKNDIVYFIAPLVGWLAAWSVGWLVCWLVS
jgi:hypothetical protein